MLEKRIEYYNEVTTGYEQNISCRYFIKKFLKKYSIQWIQAIFIGVGLQRITLHLLLPTQETYLIPCNN